MPTNAETVVADLARQAKVALTDDGRAALSSILSSTATMVPGKPVVVTADDGSEVSAVDWFAGWLKAAPDFVAPAKTAAPTAPAGETATARAVRVNAERRTNDGRKAQAEEIIARHGNPFLAGGNRSHAGLVQNLAPELAARLKKEASA